MQINSNSDSHKQNSHSFQEIDYIRLLSIFLSRCYWVVGAVDLGIIVAYLNLKFTHSNYHSSALLKFDDEKTEISELININSYYDRKDKIQFEIYEIQSRILLSQVVDLRKSKLHHTFKFKNDWGLTSNLSSQFDVDEIIYQTNVENLSFISAGPMPPSPSELLYSERMRQLFEEFNARFDYVLVDTSPIGLVSDAIPLVRTSDINIFVLRSGVTTFNAATIPDRVTKEFGLNNSVIVLNGFSNNPLHSRIYSYNKKGSYGSGQYYYTDYSTYGNKSYGYYTDGAYDSYINKVYNKFKIFLVNNHEF